MTHRIAKKDEKENVNFQGVLLKMNFIVDTQKNFR